MPDTAWSERWVVNAVLLVAMLAVPACGGRTHLVPAYQIGRLSADAVVARDAGVRVVVRTAAWTGPTLDSTIMPVELTIDNDSSRDVRIRRNEIALVIGNGERVVPLDPMAISAPDLTRQALTQRALPEGAVPRNTRTTGFVYFAKPDAESLELRIDLVGATLRENFGAIRIPFHLD